MRQTVKIAFGVMAIFATMACETNQDNSIEQAQQCLNGAARTATVNPVLAAQTASQTCEPMLQGITTPQAGHIGVGLVLVEEQELSNIQAIQTAVANQTSPMNTTIKFLIFSSATHVTNISTYAGYSGDHAETELANIVSFIYTLYVASGGALSSSSTPGQISGYLSGLAGLGASDPNCIAASNSLQSAQQNACAGSGATSSLCTQLTNTVGTNTSSCVTVLNNAASYVNSNG